MKDFGLFACLAILFYGVSAQFGIAGASLTAAVMVLIERWRVG